MGIVSSRVSSVAQADTVFEKMQRVVKKFLDKPLSNYGYILDDDEIPDKCWLEQLLLVQKEYESDIVTGPTIPYFIEENAFANF